MKKLFLAALSIVTISTTAIATEIKEAELNSAEVKTETKEDAPSTEKNNWGANLKESNFHLGVDIQTKYMWRGMEMMTEESAPVAFPGINYQYKNLYVYAMGGYALNGKYAEVDLGISYTWKGLTIGINDYYYPTTNTCEDEYLGGSRNGHWLEASLSYAPENIPFIATVSNFFAGDDDCYIDANGKEKQAFSTYIELGTYYDFLNSNRIALNVGAALNKSCYNGYEKDFSVCNVELKYTYNVSFKSGWTMPLSCAYVYNPHRDKSFVNFTTSIQF